MPYFSEKSKSDILSTKKLSECCSFSNPLNNENDLHHSQKTEEASLNNKIISNKSLDDINGSNINNIGEINNEININETFLHNINNYSPIIPRISFALDDNNNLIKYKNINGSSFMKSEKSEKKPILSQKSTVCKSFSNLSETKENSFQVNSSYDNINKISNNKYIKDFDLQNKTKDFIMKETYNLNYRSGMKNTLLRLSIVSNPINDIDSNKCKSNIKLSDNELEISKIDRMKRFRTRKSDNNSNNNSNNISNNFSNINSNNFSNNFSNNNKNTNNKNKTKKSLSITKLAEIKRKNMLSSETILNSKTMKLTHINATPKPKKKSLNKKNQNMNKKLNTISKNIKRANDSINNPNEFYMNFFNNIIQKSGLDDDDKKSKKEKKNNVKLSGSKFNFIQKSARENQEGKYTLNSLLKE